MSQASLRTAIWSCLAIWAAIWVLFLGLRFSPFDVRNIPGVRNILLPALAVTLLAPIFATGLAVVALVRQPRTSLSWFAFCCAIIVLLGQVFLFLSSRWM